MHPKLRIVAKFVWERFSLLIIQMHELNWASRGWYWKRQWGLNSLTLLNKGNEWMSFVRSLQTNTAESTGMGVRQAPVGDRHVALVLSPGLLLCALRLAVYRLNMIMFNQLTTALHVCINQVLSKQIHSFCVLEFQILIQMNLHLISASCWYLFGVTFILCFICNESCCILAWMCIFPVPLNFSLFTMCL